MCSELKNLKPYFRNNLFEDDKENLDILFEEYKKLYINNAIYFGPKKVIFKKHPYVCRNNTLPSFYSNYHEKYVHIITREKDCKREFVSDRANRIHWIKPIIENYTSNLITYFKFKESNGTIRDYFWYKKKDYVVVIENYSDKYYMITGFCIDKDNRLYFLRKECNREK